MGYPHVFGNPMKANLNRSCWSRLGDWVNVGAVAGGAAGGVTAALFYPVATGITGRVNDWRVDSQQPGQ